MLCYTVGVISFTLGAAWLIEDLIKTGWNNSYLVYAVCIILGIILISFKRKGGH